MIENVQDKDYLDKLEIKVKLLEHSLHCILSGLLSSDGKVKVDIDTILMLNGYLLSDELKHYGTDKKENSKYIVDLIKQAEG